MAAASQSPNLFNRMANYLRRRSSRRPTKENIQRWRAIDEQGAALERLMNSPDWRVLESRREIYQKLRDLVLHAPDASDDTRKQAVVEWNAIDTFFRDIRMCVKEGHAHRDLLKTVKL